MSLQNSKVQYVGSVEWGNVAAWISNHAYAAGAIITNTSNTPALGNERCYICTVAGTSTNGTLPTLTTSKGSETTDSGVTWTECTGQPGVNGDTTNSPVWVASTTATQGQIIYVSSNGSLQIVTSNGGTAGGTIPSFSATAGVTTADNTITWTSLGLASNYAAWAAPHKRILNADSGTWQTVVPAVIYISSDHAETQTASMTLSGGSGTAAAPNQYLSVSNSVAPPTAVTSGASVSTTTANGITLEGYGYYYGITFSSGSGASAATFNVAVTGATSLFTENCTLQQGTSSSSSLFNFGNTAGYSYHVNPTIVFGSTGQSLDVNGGTHSFINATVAQTGSVPTTLIKNTAAETVNFVIRDSDLSAITGTLYNAGSENGAGQILLANCKLASGVTMVSGNYGNAFSAVFRVHNCDSGSKNYRFYEGAYLGTIQQETTIVDNTNPASNGNETISWNIATTADTAFGQPYAAPEIATWNAFTSSSHTATIQINSNISLTNAQIWMELEYLGSASYPTGSIITSRAAPLATPTAYSSSSDSWGGSETYQQYMQVTFSPALAGVIKARVFVADPSITVYVNPLILVV
jgi:hypothetical protein